MPGVRLGRNIRSAYAVRRNGGRSRRRVVIGVARIVYGSGPIRAAGDNDHDEGIRRNFPPSAALVARLPPRTALHARARSNETRGLKAANRAGERNSAPSWRLNIVMLGPLRHPVPALCLPTSPTPKLRGGAVLEFGTNWCGYCRRAQPLIAEAFAPHPDLRHLKIADASGKPLGRALGVRLWPTLIFLRDGREVARLVRPGNLGEITAALAKIAA